MKPVFEPNDFDEMFFLDKTVKQVIQSFCDQANAKIQKLIDEAPIIYNTEPFGYWTDYKTIHDAVLGRIMFIEEIKKECKHEPISFQDHTGELALNPVCKNCGIELQATWRPK